MRIRYCSSDLCSSDLRRYADLVCGDHPGAGHQRANRLDVFAADVLAPGDVGDGRGTQPPARADGMAPCLDAGGEAGEEATGVHVEGADAVAALLDDAGRQPAFADRQPDRLAILLPVRPRSDERRVGETGDS